MVGGGVSGALTPLPAAPFLMDASAPSSESIPQPNSTPLWVGTVGMETNRHEPGSLGQLGSGPSQGSLELYTHLPGAPVSFMSEVGGHGGPILTPADWSLTH